MAGGEVLHPPGERRDVGARSDPLHLLVYTPDLICFICWYIHMASLTLRVNFD